MPRESRLDHIYSGLTALERAKLVLKTWHDGTREDPGWRLTMPQRQGLAFNGYIYTMNAANLYVAQMINGLDADLQLLGERCLRLVALARWAEDIDQGAPSGPRMAQPAAWRNTAPSVPARQQELDAAIHVLSESLADGASRLWSSMRAVEAGLEEMTASLAGADPLKPSHRQRLGQVREDLTGLIGCLEEFDLAVERPEPDDGLLDIVRETMPAMRHLMGS